MSKRIVVTLGTTSSGRETSWRSTKFVADIVRKETTAPLGYRLGSRILGLGVDALIVAFKARRQHPHAAYLATSPWVGAALKLLGARDVATMGIFAEPNSATFKILRRILSSSPVLAAARLEEQTWTQAGGNAVYVRYGNTFGYPVRSTTPHGGVLRIFVGGTSDRDPALIDRLATQVLQAHTPTHLTIIDRSKPATVRFDSNLISKTGPVTPEEFGRLLSSSDVAFLPLAKENSRGAGHMVCVGALECGVPVATTRVPGMTDFLQQPDVHAIDPDGDIRAQLEHLAGRFPFSESASIRERWAETHSFDAYLRRIAAALDGISPD